MRTPEHEAARREFARLMALQVASDEAGRIFTVHEAGKAIGWYCFGRHWLRAYVGSECLGMFGSPSDCIGAIAGRVKPAGAPC